MLTMRKIIAADKDKADNPSEESWLRLDEISLVEVTSEDPEHPVEFALLPGPAEQGWLAAEPGEQTLCVRFDTPQDLKRIYIVFHERVAERTQEFSLSWRGAEDSERLILRQQYNFSPPGSATEIEDYSVDLRGVTALLLRIRPEIRGGSTKASLSMFRLAGQHSAGG
jgi:hypothetical protein